MIKDDLTDRLLEIKQEHEDAKQQKSEAQGALKQNMEQLRKEFGCKTTKEAKKKADELEKEYVKLTKELEKDVEQYEKEYERWNAK